MTSTGFTVGYGDSNRASSKVLKPPGGGSSDIFGIQGGHQNTPGKMVDTQNRLFGPPEEQTTPKKVDRMKSNVFGETSEISTPRNASKRYVHRNPITGELVEFGAQTNGNDCNGTNGNSDPITGDGTPALASQPCVRIKNPPGGKSSGIF